MGGVVAPRSVRDRGSMRDALARDGYVVVASGLDDESCAAAVDGIQEFKAGNRRAVARNVGSTGALYRVVNLHLVVDALASAFSRNEALGVCDDHFGAETVLYTSLLFERGSEQSLHRDSPVFVTRPENRYLGVWVALEDVDEGNGPLLVSPGSHLLPGPDVEEMARELYGDPASAPALDTAGWDAYQHAVHEQAQARALEAVELHVHRGDVVVWHPLLFHGGAPHREAGRTRRSFVMHVTPYGVPVYHQDVFFNPAKDVSDHAPWRYYEHEGRRIARFDSVDFAHEYSRPTAALHHPGRGLGARLRVASQEVRRRLAG